MMYRVEISLVVHGQMNSQVEYYRGEMVPDATVVRWLAGLFDAVDSLREHPKRFPIDADRSAIKGYEIRRFNYGEFGVFYRVREDDGLVQILDLRHGRRRSVREEDPDGE